MSTFYLFAVFEGRDHSALSKEKIYLANDDAGSIVLT